MNYSLKRYNPEFSFRAESFELYLFDTCFLEEFILSFTLYYCNYRRKHFMKYFKIFLPYIRDSQIDLKRMPYKHIKKFKKKKSNMSTFAAMQLYA